MTVVQLGDGGIGYCSARADDCLRPAVATVLQTPIEQVPDPRLDERLAAGDHFDVISAESWSTLLDWLADRGLRLVVHEPAHAVALERWIGAIVDPIWAALQELGVERDDDSLFFDDHAVVCRYAEVVHDPAVGLQPPAGQQLRRYSLSDITYGLSFQPKEQGNG
jgi:hypothetical protein